MWWEAKFPTIAADGSPGVQWFTYPFDATVPLMRFVKQRALIDVASTDAVRHRRGAQADIDNLTITSQFLD